MMFWKSRTDRAIEFVLKRIDDLHDRSANLALCVRQLKSKQETMMATIDDLVSDESANSTAIKQLVQLTANAMNQIQTLKAQTGDTNVQAKLDQLHAAMKDDLNTITGALTDDDSEFQVPETAPVTEPGSTGPATETTVDTSAGATNETGDTAGATSPNVPVNGSAGQDTEAEAASENGVTNAS